MRRMYSYPSSIRRFLCAIRFMSIIAMVTGTFAAVGMPAAEARLAKAEDLPSVVSKDRTEINVRSDGRYDVTREVLIRVNNDHGRETESVQSIPFNSRASEIRIVEAFTDNGGKKTKVASSNIEFKEAGESRAFDAMKQAVISYPNVQNGSVIHLKYRFDAKEIPFPGFWSDAMVFYRSYIDDFSYEVKSDLPLTVWSHDPSGLLKIEKSDVVSSGISGGAKNFRLAIHSVKPIHMTVTQEEDPFLRDERGTMFTVSSLSDWTTFSRSMLPEINALEQAALPPGLAKIRDEATKEPTTVAKLNKVAAMISQAYRYFGDWRRRNGGHVPRTLSEIEATGYGDCKDLSLAAVAVYRAMGLKADMAWVLRGEIAPFPGVYTMPVDSFFNHAIARVSVEGRTYWIDPTNPVAFAQGTYPDIAGRPAWVLDREKPFLDRIPSLKASDSVQESHLVYRLKPNSNLDVSGQLRFVGAAAIDITSRAFYMPKETLNYEIVRSLAANGRVLGSKIGEYPTASRVVADTSIPVNFTLADIGLRTSAGFGFPLMASSLVGRINVDERERFSDIYLDDPGISVQNIEIVGAKRIGAQSLNCDVKSPWIELSRKVTDTAKGVLIHDRVEVTESVIPNEKLSSAEFLKLQARTSECFSRAAVILKKVEGIRTAEGN